ncbi:MAG: putative DNA-binding protein YlxM (UPF0122 family) [Paraglaciecola sp.]
MLFKITSFLDCYIYLQLHYAELDWVIKKTAKGHFMIGVLTGDIVDSTKMSPADHQATIEMFKYSIQYFTQHFAASGEIYRGDSVQISFKQPQYAMKSAVLLKMFLLQSKETSKPIVVTLALGLGEASVLGATPGVSQGSAFIYSGRGLDNASRGDLTLHAESSQLQEKLGLATKFLNHLLSSLTRKQAKVLYYYVLLNYPTHQKLADRLQTSQQNVTKHLSRIGASLVEEYLLFFEQQIIQGNG